MDRKRIFIAINLPEEVKDRLLLFQNKWSDFPARWAKKENLHITLAFLGYISDEELLTVCQTAEQIVSRHEPFSIHLKKIFYGPPRRLPPRMIWAEGEKSAELAALKEDLEHLLADKINFSPENRVFSPHITLARIKTWEWRRLEPEERPEINEEINLTFEVSSIEVMESRLKKGRAEYTILKSVSFSR